MNKKNGILILDGKAQLAMDCEKFLDKVIHPTTLKNLNVLEGISPEIFAKTLQRVNVKGKEDGNAAFFNSQARNLCFYASIFHDGMVAEGKMKFNLSSRLRLIAKMIEPVQGKSEIIDMIKFHPDFATEGTLMNDAVKKYMELQSQDPELKSNIFAVAESWIIPLLQSKTLRDWAECETSDIEFGKILEGRKYGFCLPEAEFGVAGAAITSLMKARLYDLIQARGDKRDGVDHSKRSRVFLIIDEAQRVIDETDLAILPVARSLDLVCVFATQNIDSIEEKFGESGSNVILDSFRSIIAYKSSEKTMKFISERIGKAKRRMSVAKSNHIDMSGTNKIVLGNGLYDASNENIDLMRARGEKIANESRSTNRGLMGIFSFDWLFGNEAKAIKNARQDKSNDGSKDYASFKYSDEAHAIFGGVEMQKLNTPFTAVACVERGNVPRRDIIKTHPLNNNFERFQVSTKIEEVKTAQEIEKLQGSTADELMKEFFGK